ncbi:RAM signaling pathway, SOG2 [Metarhizium brunneum]
MSDSDGLFDKILLCLQNTASIMLRILPAFGGHLTHGLRNAVRKRAPTSHIQHWKCLTRECANAIQHTQTVKREICRVKLGGRADQPGAEFWDLVISFIASWTTLVAEIMGCINKILLPPDTRARLRPIQESMKETSHAVGRSPWCDVLSMRNDRGALKATGLPGLASAPRRVSLPAVRAMDRLLSEETNVAVSVHGDGFERVDGPGHAVISLSRGDAVRHLNFGTRATFPPAAVNDILQHDGVARVLTFTAIAPADKPSRKEALRPLSWNERKVPLGVGQGGDLREMPPPQDRVSDPPARKKSRTQAQAGIGKPNGASKAMPREIILTRTST